MSKIVNFLSSNIYIILGGLVLLIVVGLLIYFRVRKSRYNDFTKRITELDREKVRAIHTPIDHELAKLNKVIKNKDLLVILNDWNDKWVHLKKDKVSEITDSILSVEDRVERNKFKNVDQSITECEKLIDDLKGDAKLLFDEICELSKLEEVIRDKFTKLKIEFRDVKREFIEREAVLIYMKKELEARIEEITENISELDSIIAVNEYELSEERITHILKEIDILRVLVDRLPDLIIIVKQIIPRKVVGLENMYHKYESKDIYLKHLDFENKIAETKVMSDEIIEKMRMLSFSDIESDIDAIVTYTDNMQEVLELETKNVYIYRDNLSELKQVVEDVNVYISALKSEIVKVKMLYDLHNFDEAEYNEFEVKMNEITSNMSNLSQLPNVGVYYFDLNREVVEALTHAKQLIDDIKEGTDKVLSLRADEQRAREQIIEIQYLVDQSRKMMKKAKLPVVPSEFRTYVADAKDGIKYIIEELDKTPISVETLNKRVDTSLDLAYKLYNNTKRIIKEAMLAEVAIIYGNRYRSSIKNVDANILTAENHFMRGKYHESLNTVVNILEKTEPGIYAQLKKYFEKGVFKDASNISR